MSRPRAEIAVTARICTLYGDFSGRSDTRFRSSINLGFRRGGPAGILKANGADQKARQILTGGLGFGKAVGIPPQVRGERIGVGWLCRVTGYTPVLTGLTQQYPPSYAHRPEYPRTRGDDSLGSALPSSRMGIPPHTRGQLRRCDGGDPPIRNTPAHAGTTFRGLGASPMVAEYPRTSGGI